MGRPSVDRVDFEWVGPVVCGGGISIWGIVCEAGNSVEGADESLEGARGVGSQKRSLAQSSSHELRVALKSSDFLRRWVCRRVRAGEPSVSFAWPWSELWGVVAVVEADMAAEKTEVAVSVDLDEEIDGDVFGKTTAAGSANDERADEAAVGDDRGV